MQQIGGLANHWVRDARAFGNVEQRVLSIGQIQHPEPSVQLFFNGSSTGRAVQAPLPQLRLAMWIEVAVSAVALQYVEDRSANTKRLRKLSGVDELQVVRG